jgi:hypothetical protein
LPPTVLANLNPNIVAIERVPLGAMRAEGRSTPCVLRVGDWLQVIGIYARTVPAQVVNRQSLWNWANHNLVRLAVSEH